MTRPGSGIVVGVLLASALIFLAGGLYFLLFADNQLIGIVLLAVFASDLLAAFVLLIRLRSQP